MSAIFLKRVFDALKTDSAIQNKYVVAFASWGEESIDHAIISTAGYPHLLFRPRNSYEWPSETNDFCLELNDDPHIGKERFAVGIRRELKCGSNILMENYLTSSFGMNNCHTGGRISKELRMNKLHWCVWSFLGDVNQYCSTNTDPAAVDFPSLLKNSSIKTTTTDFISLLREWLLKYK